MSVPKPLQPLQPGQLVICSLCQQKYPYLHPHTCQGQSLFQYYYCSVCNKIIMKGNVHNCSGKTTIPPKEETPPKPKPWGNPFYKEDPRI